VRDDPSPSTSPPASTEPPPSDAHVGTPDAPALKPRPLLFALSLLLFAGWLGVLIVWSVQLHRGEPQGLPPTTLSP
jgi:hypothetical protein